MPLLTAYFDGEHYWLADGFHRLQAYKQFVETTDLDPPRWIGVDVQEGTKRDALLHAAGANAQHGLSRSDDDKRRAVDTLLKDPEWSDWSDRAIARHCKVSHTLVAVRRKILNDTQSVTGSVASENTKRTYTTKHGTQATMQTAEIGSNQPDYAEIWQLEQGVKAYLDTLPTRNLDRQMTQTASVPMPQTAAVPNAKEHATKVAEPETEGYGGEQTDAFFRNGA
jgi:hypothetical protein